MTDLEDAVTNAVAALAESEEFDVLEYFEGATLPVGNVTLYRDADAGYRIAEILEAEEARKKQSAEEGLGLTDELEYTDEDELTELHKRLLASAVTFDLRAVAPEAKKAIEAHLRATLPYKKNAENEEYNTAFNNTIIAKSIQSVTNAAGAADTKAWTADRIEQLEAKLVPSEFGRLVQKVFELNYIGDAIDRAVHADFS